MVLKWGIVSAGMISHDFCNCLNMMNKAEHKIEAVAARNIDRAKKFAEKHGIKKVYGSYEELSQDKDVDIIYVGAVHTAHFPSCKLMLEAGKHVLCEKPMAMNYKQTSELINLAKKNKRFLMEGVWSRFTPAYRKLLAAIQEGEIGEVQSVVANFCVPVVDKDRNVDKNAGAGGLLDIGVYLLQFTSFIFGNSPSRTLFAGHVQENGVDDHCSMILQYENGTKASTLFCDTRIPNAESTATVFGSKGAIKVGNPFWSPTDLVTPSGHHKFNLGQSPTPMIHANSENFVHEIEAVGRCIKAGQLECAIMPHCDSLHLAQMLDEARKALGVTYVEDE